MSVLTKYFRISTRLQRNRLIYAIAFAFSFIVFGCLSPDLGSLSQAESGSQKILRVATSGDYPPFSDWPLDASEPTGFSISVAQAYARDTGARIEWTRFRWPELAADLAAGAFDLALSGITIRPDRSMRGRFGIPLTTSGAIALVAADSSLRFAEELDRPSIRIAVNAGGHLERVARRLFSSAQIEAIPDNASVLQRVLRGAVDAVVSDSLEAPLWMRNAEIKLNAIGPLTRDRKAAWFPPNNEPEAHRFDRWLLDAESTGLLSRLRREHGLSNQPTASPQMALLSSLDERLALMTAVADTKRILGLEVQNLTRESIVLDTAIRAVHEAARDAAIDPPDADAIKRFFRAQIEAAKWIQHRHLRRHRTTEPAMATSAERFAARSTLDESIRPALIYLGQRISWLMIAVIVETSADRSQHTANEISRELGYDDIVETLANHDLPESHLLAIYDALSLFVRHERNIAPSHRP